MYVSFIDLKCGLSSETYHYMAACFNINLEKCALNASFAFNLKYSVIYAHTDVSNNI